MEISLSGSSGAYIALFSRAGKNWSILTKTKLISRLCLERGDWYIDIQQVTLTILLALPWDHKKPIFRLGTYGMDDLAALPLG
jgi:hypothetical protein